MRFLLVDDNPTVRWRLSQLLQNAFRHRDPEILEVERIDSAMTALGTGTFDAVFFGLGLGGKDNGLELLRRMTAKVPSVVAVVHTSRAVTDPEVREALSLGAAAWLGKPARMAALAKVLDDVRIGGAPGRIH